jgi:biopolymer transport protein ExbD
LTLDRPFVAIFMALTTFLHIAMIALVESLHSQLPGAALEALACISRPTLKIDVTGQAEKHRNKGVSRVFSCMSGWRSHPPAQ